MPLPLYQEKENKELNSIGSVVAIAAGKGGVGKSTMTVNIARSLSSMGYKVGILDADVYGPSLRRMLPEDRLPSQKGEIISPALSEGIKYISMAYFRKDNEAAVVRAPIANGVIQQFISGVDWGTLDFLLIDFPPGTGDIQLTLAQKAYLAAAVLVTTPQEVSVMDVRKAAKMFDQVKVPLLGVVENMSYYQNGEAKQYLFGRGGGERLARELGIPLLGQVPIDSAISEAGDMGKPLLPNSGSNDSFLSVTKEVISQLNSLKSGQAALSIESIETGNGEFLKIRWKSNSEQVWKAQHIQQNCPCANCVDEQTGKRRPTARAIDETARIKAVRQVGRYALQVQFFSGCSTGIFDFDYLLTIPTEPKVG